MRMSILLETRSRNSLSCGSSLRVISSTFLRMTLSLGACSLKSNSSDMSMSSFWAIFLSVSIFGEILPSYIPEMVFMDRSMS